MTAPTTKGFSIPASVMGIVLGMASLSNCWRVAHTLCGVRAEISDALFAVTTLIWAVLVVSFAAKWLAHLIPVATLLIAVWPHSFGPAIGTSLIVIGVIAQLAFSTLRSAGMMRGGRKLGDTTAVMNLPTVAGNFFSAMAMTWLGWMDLAKLFFGAGLETHSLFRDGTRKSDTAIHLICAHQLLSIIPFHRYRGYLKAAC